jgi:hypothetical protein
MGDYARPTRAETLLGKTYDGGIPNDLAALKGALRVDVRDRRWQTNGRGAVKAMTGGDTLGPRFLAGEFFHVQGHVQRVGHLGIRPGSNEPHLLASGEMNPTRRVTDAV